MCMEAMAQVRLGRGRCPLLCAGSPPAHFRLESGCKHVSESLHTGHQNLATVLIFNQNSPLRADWMKGLRPLVSKYTTVVIFLLALCSGSSECCPNTYVLWCPGHQKITPTPDPVGSQPVACDPLWQTPIAKTIYIMIQNSSKMIVTK